MERKDNWDFVKTVLMFFVVYGHVCPQEADWTPVTRVIGLFVMPLFFFISGYFQTKITGVSSLLLKYKRTFFRIIVPLTVFGIIYVFGEMIVRYGSYLFNWLILCKETLLGILSFLKYSPYYIASFYWFLSALLICIFVGSIMSCLLYWSRIGGLIILVVSLASFCWMPQDFYNFSFMWFFYGVGMIYKQAESLINPFLRNKYIVFSAFVGIIITLYLGAEYPLEKTFYYSSNLISNSNVFFIMERYFQYLMTSILVLYAINVVYSCIGTTTVARKVVSYGKDTLFIYLFHVLLFHFFYFPVAKPYLLSLLSSGTIISYMISLVLTIVCYAVSQHIAICCGKNKFLSILLMGNAIKKSRNV